MEDTLAFRNVMAEVGYEYTPAQAGELMVVAEDFRQLIHDDAREDHKKYEELVNLTLEQKQDLCRQFVEGGQEVTLSELDELIGIVLEVYEEEKLF